MSTVVGRVTFDKLSHEVMVE